MGQVQSLVAKVMMTDMTAKSNASFIFRVRFRAGRIISLGGLDV